MARGYVSALCEFYTYSKSGARTNKQKVYGFSHVDDINTETQREFLLQNAIQHGASKYLYANKMRSGDEYNYVFLYSRIHKTQDDRARTRREKIQHRPLNMTPQNKRKVHKTVLVQYKEKHADKKYAVTKAEDTRARKNSKDYNSYQEWLHRKNDRETMKPIRKEQKARRVESNEKTKRRTTNT